MRPGDVIARLGGDEFVVAAECAGPADAATIAQKLLDALGLSMRVGGQEVTAGGSIAISLFPQDAGTKELLFQTADTAMYGAKRAGRNRYRFFEPEMTLAAQARMALEMALRPALARGEFELHYQPRIDLRTMAVVGLEALIRWNSADLGRVSPGEFKAFVDMAHALKLSVVAEGVETAEVLDFLRAADCDEVQGYLMARPMPFDALQSWLDRAARN
jgi:predicted signal transduction protein with EAL and GGDEF domain